MTTNRITYNSSHTVASDFTGNACPELSRREMLYEFGIIDMPVPINEVASGNGRIGVYPVLRSNNGNPHIARFFSPDPFVQAPGFSQSYNRYSYVMNNPLVYTDPSGELVIWDSWITGFVSGFFSTGTGRWTAAWNEANHRAGNDAKIWGGLFAYDNTYSGKGDFFRDVWQVVSRLTWELPQTVAGFLGAQSVNLVGAVNEVNYFRGRTVVSTTFGDGGLTLSSYIMGNNLRPDFRDHLFVHEYGHTIQSRRWGPLYVPAIAIPSGLSAWWSESLGESHDLRWFEANASRLGGEYFDEEFGSGADGYFEGSENHFDINSYENERVPSPYTNPRNGGDNRGGHPFRGVSQWNDPLLYFYLTPLLFLL